MLKKLFGKQKHEKLEQPRSQMEFLGQPSGDGLKILEEEISKRLSEFPSVIGAYLSRLKYSTEENTRLSLVIDSSEKINNVGAQIANTCAGVVPLDIIFFESISKENVDYIRSNCKKFYAS